MARRSQSVVDIRTRNPLLQPSPLVHELATMAILAVLGIIAARLNVQIPHTQVFIDGRWVFGYMGFVLLRRWPLAILPACILSLATFKDLSPWFALTANLSYAIPSFLLIRAAHDRVLSRLSSLVWYGLGWMLLVLLSYQLFITPMVWGFSSVLRHEPFWGGVLRGWLTQPFLLESVLVAMVSGSVLVALRSHAEMSRSHEQLATTLDSIGDAVVSTDADGCITRMNPVARELTGWSLDEAVGRPFDEVIRLEDSQTGEPLNAPVAEVLDRDHAVEMSNTTTLIAHDGTRRHIADNASPLHSSSGQLVGVVMVFRDVTEAYRRRRSLQHSRDMLRRTEAIAHVGSWEWDIAADRVTWSDELYRIFGRQPEGDTVNWAEHDVLYTPDSMARLRSAVERTVRDGTPYELELQAVRPDGEIRHCFCRGHAEMGPDGKAERLFGSMQDITELRTVKRELRDSEQRFRSFVESANDVLYAIAPSGVFTYVSPNWMEYMGEPAENAIGQSFARYVHPEDVRLCQEFLDEVLSAGEKRSTVEYRVHRVDGVVRWQVSNGSPLRDEDGNIIGFIGIARDVTEQKQRRDAFARFCDMSADLICLADINTATFLQVNPAATEILGYSEEELLSQPFTNFVHPDDLEATRRIIEEQLKRGQKVVSFENRYFRKNGDICWLHWNSHPIAEEGLTYAIAHDITDRKRAQEKLQESEERFRLLLSDIDRVSVQGYAPDGTVVYWNKGSEYLYGYTAEEAMGQNLLDLIIPPELEHQVRAAMAQMAQTGTAIPPSELTLMRKDGSLVTVYSSHSIVQRPGHDQELFCIDIDLTDMKAAEVEREKLQAQLLQAQKMEAVGRLAGGVAHDFNNKLQTILGYSDILLHEEHMPRSLREYINEISQAARQSADLTRQLLAFARKQTIVPQVLDLNQMIPDMLRMLKPLISEEIDLQWHAGDHVGSVRMDPAQVDQILANLVVNARDAIEQNGTITVETASADIDAEYVRQNAYARAGKHAVLIVTDDGAGMDAQTLEQVFEPFFTTKPQNQGTGLGLATVYGIVKQNGGFVNVYSEPDKGTTFRIYLPQSDGEEPAAPTEARTAMLQTGSETILLVEDDPAILRLGQETLEKLGYTVLAAERPSTALEMIDEGHEIDLLVTDVVMPEMNGKNLLEQLTQHRPGLHALFMSGYTANVIAHRGVLDDGVEFLQKPFRAMDLAWSVRRILDQGRTANDADIPPEMS